MKPISIIIAILILAISSYGQPPKVEYKYDKAGNRIQRSYFAGGITAPRVANSSLDSLFNASIDLAPNPAIELTNVYLPSTVSELEIEEVYHVTMYDLAGKTYGTWKASSGILEISLVNLPEQIYIIDIRNSKYHSIKKVHKKKF